MQITIKIKTDNEKILLAAARKNDMLPNELVEYFVNNFLEGVKADLNLY